MQAGWSLHVFGLSEEAGEPGKNSHKHKENMQIPQRKASANQWIQAHSDQFHQLIQYVEPKF